MVAVEAGVVGSACIVCMYLSYLIFDVVTLFYQSKTYVNEYMIQEEFVASIQNQKIVEEKIKKYNKSKKESETK